MAITLIRILVINLTKAFRNAFTRENLLKHGNAHGHPQISIISLSDKGAKKLSMIIWVTKPMETLQRMATDFIDLKNRSNKHIYAIE